MGLIDADKAKCTIMDEIIAPDWFKTVVCMALSNMPTVDPVKHGHWIKDYVNGQKCMWCSNCKNIVYPCSSCGFGRNIITYCPWCGA